MASTKIELSHNKIARTEGLDELAAILFPSNRNHQRIFVAVFVELKWSDDQFLPTLTPIVDKYALSRRVLETVRAKMRRMGIIDHVSRFNKKYGYREGWVFSSKFAKALSQLSYTVTRLRERKEGVQYRKDRDALKYI